MEIKNLTNKISEIVKKYRYAFIVLLIGLLLMMLPTFGKGGSNSQKSVSSDQAKQSFEERLSRILSKVDGAGDVDVILTVAAGEEIIYQTDNDDTNNDTSTSKRTDTVTVTDSERNQLGLIRQVKPEIYMGAIIVCQGADNPNVRLAIVDAVSRITGLGANCISVLKMK